MLYALLNDKDPVLVSFGLSALTSNWDRVHLYMQQLIEYYSEIGFVVALPFVSDEPEERRVCPEVYKGCSFGLYSSKQIESCKDPGIVV
jgi:hypothetical protein